MWFDVAVLQKSELSSFPFPVLSSWPLVKLDGAAEVRPPETPEAPEVEPDDGDQTESLPQGIFTLQESCKVFALTSC